MLIENGLQIVRWSFRLILLFRGVFGYSRTFLGNLGIFLEKLGG